ncbi:hypothetical protein PHJA_002982500 [Phtheirospermum japonicum]|uniref:Uncharacterized protein n=1 Tax=Phtheirospermum japonicum TaxID=374723 RepID=A0A830DKC0_9LAMI|nr:hypothetical protein PHJA_002982500 [Phtheirospermum japonicum]
MKSMMSLPETKYPDYSYFRAAVVWWILVRRAQQGTKTVGPMKSMMSLPETKYPDYSYFRAAVIWWILVRRAQQFLLSGKPELNGNWGEFEKTQAIPNRVCEDFKISGRKFSYQARPPLGSIPGPTFLSGVLMYGKGTH